MGAERRVRAVKGKGVGKGAGQGLAGTGKDDRDVNI